MQAALACAALVVLHLLTGIKQKRKHTLLLKPLDSQMCEARLPFSSVAEGCCFVGLHIAAQL
jgi:hypothetical protein